MTSISTRDERALEVFASQHFLYFRPLPQGQASFRPGFAIARSSCSGQSTTMKTPVALALAVFALMTAGASAQGRMSRTLDIYLIDVEGGNATLFVAPSGESLLIDTGNSGAAATRDADRIMAAITNAGVRQIDHLITTHYHGDHFGAMAELAGRIPIRNFIDHGPNVQPNAERMRFSRRSTRPSTPRAATRSCGPAIVSRWATSTCVSSPPPAARSPAPCLMPDVRIHSAPALSRSPPMRPR